MITARGVDEAAAGMEAADAAVAAHPEAIGLGKQRPCAERAVHLLQAAGAARSRCPRGVGRRGPPLAAEGGRRWSSAARAQQEHGREEDCGQRFAIQQLLQRRRR